VGAVGYVKDRVPTQGSSSRQVLVASPLSPRIPLRGALQSGPPGRWYHFPLPPPTVYCSQGLETLEVSRLPLLLMEVMTFTPASDSCCLGAGGRAAPSVHTRPMEQQGKSNSKERNKRTLAPMATSDHIQEGR
jgi:hypothetical protein